MSYNEIISSIAEIAEKNHPAEEGDYYQDGILYCGKCHTPKEHVDTILDVGRKVRCLCECRQKEIADQEARLRRQARADRINELRRMGFPDSEMQKWTFEQDDQSNKRLSEIARRYVDKFPEMRKQGKGLILYGGVGTGKSFISACIANALIEKGYACMMTNIARLTNTLQGMFEGRQEYIDGLDRFDLLIIDDLGSERETEYMAEVVQNIIDSRYRCGKPLIVTTNMSGDDLKHPADLRKQRTFSRLYEMCFPVEVKGEDRRKKALKSQYEELSELLGIT